LVPGSVAGNNSQKFLVEILARITIYSEIELMRFDGKTALVTGGSRGIGRACVARLAAEGANVAFVYHSNEQAAESLVSQYQSSPGQVQALQADVRDLSRAHQIVDQLIERWQRIDVLVNSAGIVLDGLLGAMTQEQWQNVIETNLGGTYNYCHAVTQPMMMERRGSIVNLSSTAAEFASRGQVNYAASKGGIDGLTRAMAKELAARNIRVNAVAPGMIETDMSQVVRGVAGEQIKKIIPLKRIGKAEEIAAVVAFLASDDASYLTGQVIRVDGGLSLGGY
jgi:3-oxoacyl-[acyl-carrier protein] reductase